MAGRETADIVFCMDASGSMSPTFKGVRDHVVDLLQSLKEGRVEVTTSNPGQPKIVVDMRSDERLDWCVIAMLDNGNPKQPWMYAVNRVVADKPDVGSSTWRPE